MVISLRFGELPVMHKQEYVSTEATCRYERVRHSRGIANPNVSSSLSSAQETFYCVIAVFRNKVAIRSHEYSSL